MTVGDLLFYRNLREWEPIKLKRSPRKYEAHFILYIIVVTK